MAFLGLVRRTQRVGRIVVALGWLSSLAASDGEAQSSGDPIQREIEAAYLLNFTRYVDWPAASFLAPDATVNLCVSGAADFRPVLERAVLGRRTRGRSLRVLTPDAPGEAGDCHVLYLGESRSTAAKWLAELEGRPVLTVGQGSDFLRDGGMIAFVVLAETVRFEIDADRARKEGLQISSRVLALATRPRAGSER